MFKNTHNSLYTYSLMSHCLILLKDYHGVPIFSLVPTPFWFDTYKATRKFNELEGGLMAFCLPWSAMNWCNPETEDTRKAVAAFILSTPVADAGVFEGLE